MSLRINDQNFAVPEYTDVILSKNKLNAFLDSIVELAQRRQIQAINSSEPIIQNPALITQLFFTNKNLYSIDTLTTTELFRLENSVSWNQRQENNCFQD